MAAPERHAPRRRRIVGARAMQEDRAALARHDRCIVVPDDDDQIVEMIAAPKLLRAGRVGQAYRLVVPRIARRIAPAVGGRQRPHRQSRHRHREPIRPVEDFAQRPSTDRRSAIALTFVEHKPAAPDRPANASPAGAREP